MLRVEGDPYNPIDPAREEATRVVVTVTCTDKGQHKRFALATFRLMSIGGRDVLDMDIPKQVGMAIADIEGRFEDGRTVTFHCKGCSDRHRVERMRTDRLLDIASRAAAAGLTSLDYDISRRTSARS